MRSLAENQDVAGLHKMPTGIEGFDAVTGGGLPRNRTSLILGGPGGGSYRTTLQCFRRDGKYIYGAQFHIENDYNTTTMNNARIIMGNFLNLAQGWGGYHPPE